MIILLLTAGLGNTGTAHAAPNIINHVSFNLYNEFADYFIDAEFPLNKTNWMEIAGWTDKSVMDLTWRMDWNYLFGITFNPVIVLNDVDSKVTGNYLSPEHTGIRVEKASLQFMLFKGLIGIEIGKLLPEYGSAYVWKITDFFKRELRGSKFMVDSLVFINEYFTGEFIYAPNRDWLPDDYSDTGTMASNDDFYLARIGLTYGAHSANLIYFHRNNGYIGINYSAQAGEGLIPYFEAVFSMDNRIPRLEKASDYTYEFNSPGQEYWQVVAGINYTPSFIDWSIYLELFYNGDGYSGQEWRDFGINFDGVNTLNGSYTQAKHQVLSTVLNTFSGSDMSQEYAALHIRNNTPYLRQYNIRFNFDDSVIMTWPPGVMNTLKLSLTFLTYFTFKFSWTTVPYAENPSEYYFSSPYKNSYSLRLSYGFKL